jgi:hypothetical protein
MQFVTAYSPPGTAFDLWEEWRRDPKRSVTKRVRSIYMVVVGGIPLLVSCYLLTFTRRLIFGPTEAILGRLGRVVTPHTADATAVATVQSLEWLWWLVTAISLLAMLPFLYYSFHIAEKRWVEIREQARSRKRTNEASVTGDQGKGAPVPPGPTANESGRVA